MKSNGKNDANGTTTRPGADRQVAAAGWLIDTVLTQSTVSIRTPLARSCQQRPCEGRRCSNGEGGIRTHGTAMKPYAGLANRCIQPLCHLSESRRVSTASGCRGRGTRLVRPQKSTLAWPEGTVKRVCRRFSERAWKPLSPVARAPACRGCRFNRETPVAGTQIKHLRESRLS